MSLASILDEAVSTASIRPEGLLVEFPDGSKEEQGVIPCRVVGHVDYTNEEWQGVVASIGYTSMSKPTPMLSQPYAAAKDNSLFAFLMQQPSVSRELLAFHEAIQQLSQTAETIAWAKETLVGLGPISLTYAYQIMSSAPSIDAIAWGAIIGNLGNMLPGSGHVRNTDLKI